MPHGTMWSASILISAPRTGSLPAGEIWAEHSVQGKWKGSPKGKALSPHNWDNFFPSSGRKSHPLSLNQSLILMGLPCCVRERERKKEREHESKHCHAWVPSPAEGRSQSLPDIGVIPQSSMPC